MNYISKNVPPAFQKGGLRVTSNIFPLYQTLGILSIKTGKKQEGQIGYEFKNRNLEFLNQLISFIPFSIKIQLLKSKWKNA